MFGPPGRLYVYRAMGLHHCANVVCGADGEGTAVLIRALAPTRGLATMRVRRAGRTDRELCNGPGKLCAALGIDLECDGGSLLSGALAIWPPRADAGAIRVMAGPRIGISRATELPYRLFVDGHACVTRAPESRRARPLVARAAGGPCILGPSSRGSR